MNVHVPRYFVYWLGLVLVVGCGSGDGRVAVKGTVTIKNEPLKSGSIQFVPLDGKGTQSGAEIKDGAFIVPKTAGLLPGKYLVRITAGDGKTPSSDEAGAGGPGGNTNIVSFDIIPEDYGANSKQQIDITDKGPNEFTFAIPQARTPTKKK